MAQTGNNKIDFSDLTPSEIIKQIYNKVDWMSHVNDRLEFKEYSLPQDANESLDNLVSLYTNKKSKRVGYAGKKLKKLFVDLPGVEQRKVGLALLMGNMTDSEWVCKRLNNYKPSFDKDWIINWHPCYENAVEECWNKYHGKYCGRILIQFCPEDIVRKYIDNLIDNDNYFYICRRFVNKPWFKLDIEKLKRCTFINAYLSIMYKTDKGIPEDEARLLLYQWIGVLTNILILVTDKLIEGVERGLDALVGTNTLQEEVHGIGECHLLGSRRWFIVSLPQREDKCLDGLLLLNVEHSVLDIERIEGYRITLLVGEVDAVLATCTGIDKVAQPLIRVTRIDKQHMRTLFIILSYHMVGEEGFSTARRTEDELVAVGDDTTFHRQIRNIQMDRLARQAVHHTHTERRE